MTARELHDATLDLLEKGVDRLCYGTDERQIVLRALDLLAATEGSEDAIVRELREQADEERDFQYADRAKLLDKAAAALVAMRAAKEKAEAERDRLKECVWKLRGEILDMASRGMYTQKSAEAAEDAFALLRNTTEEE